MGKAFLYGVGGGSGGGGALQDKTTALDMSQGDQEIVADAGYDGLSKAVVTRPATLIPENIKNGVSVGGVTGSYVGSAIPNDLDDLVDGTITTFTMPEGKTKVKQYLFYQVTSLTYANLQGATYIDNSAFSGCTNAEIILPSTLTNIGSSAFGNAGKANALMNLNCMSRCTMGSYAFQNARIARVKGSFSTIADYAFDSGLRHIVEIDIDVSMGIGAQAFRCTNNSGSLVTKLHVVLNGTLSSNSFQGHDNVTDLSITGNITRIAGSGAFQYLGARRSNPEQNVLVLDFSTSSFDSLPGSTFNGRNSTYGLTYMEITLPQSLRSLGATEFRYMKNSNIFFTSQTPPTIQTTTFNSVTNTTIWVPYNNVNAYRTAANWNAAAMSSLVNGYAPAGTFTTGQTLPTINEEGYSLTWYSDAAMTTQITTVTDASQKLYCVVGTTLIVYKFKYCKTKDCSIVVTDGTNTYSQGDWIPNGASITITATGTDPNKASVYLMNINGTDYAPLNTQTITVTSALSIKAMYYDGTTAFDSTFSANSWQDIKDCCQLGLVGNFWNVSDTKNVTLTNGDTYAVRIADLVQDRYDYTSGAGSTQAVFEFVDVIVIDGESRFVMNDTTTSVGGYAASKLKTTIDQTVYNLLPSELRELLEYVNILTNTGMNTTIVAVPAKLFPAGQAEAFLNTEQYASSYWIDDSNGKGRFQVYNGNESRKKYIHGTTTYRDIWWIRSADKSRNGWFYNVYNGAIGNPYGPGNAKERYGISVYFAW